MRVKLVVTPRAELLHEVQHLPIIEVRWADGTRWCQTITVMEHMIAQERLLLGELKHLEAIQMDTLNSHIVGSTLYLSGAFTKELKLNEPAPR